LRCRLCLNEADLLDSHIVPAFVFKWIKDTSATGYLRGSANPNKRMQDGSKEEFLCSECEQRFSILEKAFAERIFVRYVTEDLNERGVARGSPKFEYKEWLLQFAVSVQWRVAERSRHDQRLKESVSEKDRQRIDLAAETWRQYLLGHRSDTGKYDHHLIFLQSLSGAMGRIPDYIEDWIDVYLLRATDATVVGSASHLGVYSKLGPIALYTSIIPKTLSKMKNTRIHKRGTIHSVQMLLNPKLTSFMFVERPKEALALTKHSVSQERRIVETMKKNPERANASMTRMVADSARRMKDKKGRKPKENA